MHAASADPDHLPAGQLEQAESPPLAYLPAGQADAVLLVEPATHAYPAAQDPLHALDVSPEVLPNLPPGHALVHVGDTIPGVDPYRPAGQGVHDPAPSTSPNRPAGHTVHAAAPARLNCPAGHARACVAPAEHACPSGHTVPLVQPVAASTAPPAPAPAGKNMPPAQAVHAAELLAAAYWPAGQRTHRLDPSSP